MSFNLFTLAKLNRKPNAYKATIESIPYDKALRTISDCLSNKGPLYRPVDNRLITPSPIEYV